MQRRIANCALRGPSWGRVMSSASLQHQQNLRRSGNAFSPIDPSRHVDLWRCAVQQIQSNNDFNRLPKINLTVCVVRVLVPKPARCSCECDCLSRAVSNEKVEFWLATWSLFQSSPGLRCRNEKLNWLHFIAQCLNFLR